MIFIGAIIVGLLLNYFFLGFDFNTGLCFFVGLFLIMPILLEISFKDIKEIFKNKKLIGVNILLNFILVPLLAFIIGYFVFGVNNYHFIIAMILLALIPGGGLLMSWLKQTKSNIHIGFVLFTINLFLFSIAYIAFNFGVEKYIKYTKEQTKKEKQINNNIILKNNFTNNLSPINFGNIVKKQEEKKETGCAIQQISKKVGLSNMPSCFQNNSTMIYGFFGFIALILIPFIVSRIILFFAKKDSKIFKYAPKLSKLSAFILISYIFSLNYIRGLFSIDISLLTKSIIALLIFYVFLAILILVLLKKLKLENDIKKAVFWNAFTRFITLALILTFLYAIAWGKADIIVIPILAYFIQIGFALILARYLK